MVAAIRRGTSIRSVARQFRLGSSTVHRWVIRAKGKRLDRVDWSDRPAGPHDRPANRVGRHTEEKVLRLRRELKLESDLGEYGDAAIHRELIRQGHSYVPSIRTIGRILERRGALDGNQRVRRPAPPRGWYLPEVAAGKLETDSFDIVSGLVIEGGTDVEILNVISLHGGLTASWPRPVITARVTVMALLEHWRQTGLPGYAQFDNDSRFQGAHQFPDNFGRVTRLCLSLQVTPVFTPPRETGFQAAIESYNGRWQAKVWQRFHYSSLGSLQNQSARFVAATRARAAERILAAPLRRSFPHSWQHDSQTLPTGKIVFLRRSNDHGQVRLLGHSFPVDPLWAHRLVRGEVDLDSSSIRFYALRRRKPTYQPLLAQFPYQLPSKPFQG
jgi:transposase-like protein